jgi:hypothetical protein
MPSNTNKIIGAVIAIAVILSIVVYIYVNLPKQTEEPTPEDTDDRKTAPAIFTISYDVEQKNYTLSELLQLESYTGRGGYRTQSGSIKGLGNYTGVAMSTLISMFPSLPNLYSLEIFSEDEARFYNYSTIIGNVSIYNPSNASDPNPIGTGTMTMVLAYQYEGDWLNESNDGKLKIVFLDNEGSITESSLWWKKVTSIRLITE